MNWLSDYAKEVGTPDWPIKMTPTPYLRFVRRNDRFILQQQWIRETRLSQSEEWLDIPEGKEEGN